MPETPDQAVLSVLRRWFADAEAATIQPLGRGSGFSGARLWKVDHAGAHFVLRLWPPTTTSTCRLIRHQGLQQHLAARGAPVPAPVLMLEGGISLTTSDRFTWSLSTWRPGVADYWTDPRPAKLRAAMIALAEAHVAAADYAQPDGRTERGVGASRAMATRYKRLSEIDDVAMSEMYLGLNRCVDENEKALASEAVYLIESTAHVQRRALVPWLSAPFALQWRLGDVWHDHVLFTDDRVTGLIDLAAAGIDSPSTDVARLLGSLVGDDRERWRQGLDAYQSVRPLSDMERAAVDHFDRSGTVLSVANWVQWLWPMQPSAAPVIANRPAAIERLRRLVVRLRVLAG
jgi:Ser/Thr protein kinase RdoA (MazF antagonist)